MSEQGGIDVLIRCDGGAALGLGHVKRCVALAERLSATHRLSCHFLGRYESGAAAVIEAGGFALSSLGEEAEARAIATLVRERGARLVLFDIRTDLGVEALGALRQDGIRIVTLDDGSPRRLAADIAALPPTRAARALDWTGFGGEALIGWAWMVLAAAPLPRIASDGPPRLLVSMGGSDPAGLTRRCADALRPLDAVLRPLFVIGAACPQAEAVKAHLARLWPGAEILYRPPSLASAIAKADLALIAYGVTAQELAAAGVPALYLALGSDHLESAQALAETGAGRALGLAAVLRDDEIGDAVAQLAADAALRARMGAAGRLAIDGQGAARLAARMARLIAS